MKLRKVNFEEADAAMEIINMAERHLREQGVDQWQDGYPDYDCIKRDIELGRGYFTVCGDDVLGYMCIDFEGEPAYDTLIGKWASDEKYVVLHRLALADDARGKGFGDVIFSLVEELARSRGVGYFRVDTDADNLKMQRILNKNGFSYRGNIRFQNSDKIAFDKIL